MKRFLASYPFFNKKVFLQLLFGLYLSLFCISLSAQVLADTVSFCPSVTYLGNDKARVDIRTAGFNDINSMQFTMTWDETEANFDSVGNFHNLLCCIGSGNFGTNSASEGSLTFSWLDFALNGESLPDSSVVFSIFLSLNLAELQSFSFSSDPVPIEIINSTLDPILPLMGALGCTSDSYEYIYGAVNICPTITDLGNDKARADIYVTDFKNIVNMDFGVEWLDSEATIDSVGSLHPILSEFTGDILLNTNNVEVSYTDADLEGHSLPKQSILFSIYFSLNTPDITYLSVADDPFFEALVGSSETTEIPAIGGDLSCSPLFFLELDTIRICPSIIYFENNKARADIRITNFDSIQTTQFSVTWDGQEASLDSVGNFNSDMGLMMSSFGLGAEHVSIAWFDFGLQGVTLADGSILFSIYFTTNGSEVPSLGIGEVPTPIEFTNTAMEVIPGVPEDLGCESPFSGPIFICSKTKTEGNQFIADVLISNFNNITAFDLSIEWNPNKLTFNSAAPNSTIAPMLNLQIPPNSPNGTVILDWADVETSFPNQDTLIRLVFDIIGVDPGNVNISESPAPSFVYKNDNTMIATPNCNLFQQASITGRIYRDENNNCQYDAGEVYLENIIIKNNTDLANFYDKTDTSGYYWLNLLGGENDIEVIPPNPLFQACQPSYTFDINGDTAIVLDIPLQPIISCPLMEVNIGTPFVRYCFPNTYYVTYCNLGTVTAENAYVEVLLDPYFTPISSSIPWSSNQGDLYTFDLGDVAYNECGGFFIQVEMDCDSTEVGQTHCVSANIYPDTICIPSANYSGAEIEVSGSCTGDSVQFIISNIGTSPMAAVQQYIVIEDQVILMQGDFDLNDGESTSVSVAATGAMYRLEAGQEINYPLPSSPSVTIETCTPADSISSLGFFNWYPQDEGSPFNSRDCQESIAAWDPNDKQAFPEGYGPQHYIEANTSIEYKIHFQNTGNDTAFKVVLLDTLSEHLDFTTIQVGASSHPFSWDLTGEGVLSFVFNDIMLPDSNVNEPASHGFIYFTIDQEANNAIGTVINNSAAIYFDFNAPVITNETIHTIGEDFIEKVMVSTYQPLSSNGQLLVSPNPTNQNTFFQWSGERVSRGRFSLYSSTGKLILQQFFAGNQWQLDADGLAEGIYFFDVSDNGRQLATGKLVVY